jgi:hypothetical protein
MGKGVADGSDLDRVAFPNTAWVVKTVLIALVNRIDSVLVAKDCGLIGDAP